MTSMKQVLMDLVVNPFQNHPATEGWTKQVLEKDENYYRNTLLNRGRVDFNTPPLGLTTDDLVLLYCTQYLEMHIASGIFLLNKLQNWHGSKKPTAFNSSTLIYDFGCGPLTFGLSMLAYWKNSSISKIPPFYYMGIDRSVAMLRKAQDVATYANLFHNTTNFQFLNAISDIENHPLNLSENHLLKVIINFSYLFSSHFLNLDELGSTLNFIQEKYPNVPTYILYQNPKLMNENWDKFRGEQLSLYMSVNTSVKGFSNPAEEVVLFNLHDLTNTSYSLKRHNQQIKLYYDILVKHPGVTMRS